MSTALEPRACVCWSIYNSWPTLQRGGNAMPEFVESAIGRMRVGVLCAAMTLVVSSPRTVMAQADAVTKYPERTVTLVASYPAGGAVDITTRITARILEKQLGQPVIVENLGGASGSIGAQKVVNATPDGYTLLMGSVNEVVIAPINLPSVKYKPQDLAPIGLTGTTSAVLFGRQGMPTTLAELVTIAKKEPGKFTMGVSGFGTLQYLAAVQFMQVSGIEVRFINYRGASALLPDILSGNVDLGVLTLPSVEGQLVSNTVIHYGLLSKDRSKLKPQYATVNETDTIAGIDSPLWIGVFAPRGTPQAIIEKLHKALSDARKDSDWEIQQAKIGEGTLPLGTPSSVAAFVTAQDQLYRDLYVKGLALAGAAKDAPPKEAPPKATAPTATPGLPAPVTK
jgi:tripartite-type tricarboxylate transporter receptor subunit TctC